MINQKRSQKVAVFKNSGSEVSALLSRVVTAVVIPQRNTDAANVLLVKTSIMSHLMSELPLPKGSFFVDTSSGLEFPRQVLFTVVLLLTTINMEPSHRDQSALVAQPERQTAELVQGSTSGGEEGLLEWR